MHGRSLVSLRYSVLDLANVLNRLCLEETPLEPALFNPLYFIEQEDQRTLILNQIAWQIVKGEEQLVVFKVSQIDRRALVGNDYDSECIRKLFLFSEFSQRNLGELHKFLGCEYLDSCYISELGGRCTLVTQSGNRVAVDVGLEYVAGIVKRLEGLCVIVKSTISENPKLPYLFKGKPSPYKNAPPLPFD
uniref:Uncharacterized protein n=1 Tax=Grapevine virus E TaxID=516956 RepID=A0A515VFR3_9VIRU|nr:hypothetical protein [Grapevine virus E]